MPRVSRFRAYRPLLGLVLAAAVVTGCSLLKKKQDAGAEDDPAVANAPTVTVTGSGAKNEKDVLRYKNETAIPDEAAVIGKDVTKVRTFPGSGAEVATLSKGTGVVKIAKFFSTGVLIVFTDPGAADGSKLMGWIAPEALAAPVAVATTATTPTAAGTFVAPKVDAGGAKDAGVVDAGKDSGIAAVDAGGGASAPSSIFAVPTGGKCPAGLALFGPFCRKPCNSETDCPKGTFCTLGAGPKKSCSATK